MAISGIAIYFILSLVINNQIDEQLAANLQHVETRLAANPQPIFFEPFTEISITKETTLETTFSDTLIYNEFEKEYEEFRQIQSVANIDGKHFSITIRKSKIESEDLLETLALVTVVAMLLLTATLIFVNRKVAKSVWMPFYNNLEIIEQFSVNDQNPVLMEKTGIKEFEKLNLVITQLTNKVIADYQNLKQFTEDASHELQTPLAIISSQIEALLNMPELQRIHAEELNKIYTSVQRLAKLNKSIVLLSKIENNQFSLDEKTNITKVLSDKLEEFSELIHLKKLTLETSLKNEIIIPIPTALAEILVNNLLSNSINHNTREGKIKIEMKNNQLLICNTGQKEISDPEKIFNRFYKVDTSSNSVGLGLAIVKKICDLQHYNITYGYTNSYHCFTVQF